MYLSSEVTAGKKRMGFAETNKVSVPRKLILKLTSLKWYCYAVICVRKQRYSCMIQKYPVTVGWEYVPKWRGNLWNNSNPNPASLSLEPHIQLQSMDLFFPHVLL